MADDKKFSEPFRCYKAKPDGNGAASQWNLSSEKDSVFIEMSQQKNGKDDNNNYRFDWENKIRFKLGETDIGEFLAVLTGLQDGVGPFDASKNKHKGLYHSTQKGSNAILYFWKDEPGRFHIYLSVKKGEEQTIVKHAISKGEACVLSTLLRRAIEVIYRWH